MRTRHVSFILISILFSAFPVLAEDLTTAGSQPAALSKPENAAPETPWWKKILSSLEKNRDSTTQKYLSMSRSIDQYFYGKPLDETTNKSYIKLELENTAYKGGEIEQDVKLRAKLDLPNTKRRAKLVFTSSADLEESLEERVTNDASGQQRIKKDDSFAGIEFTPLKKPTDWKTDFTAGIKLRTPLLPFAKYNLENNWKLPDQWTSNFEQIFWYLDDDGFGETSRLQFNRPITKSYQMALSSELEFRDQEDSFYYDLILSTTHRLNPTSSIEYYTGAIGASQPTNQVTSYILGTTYRKVLHEDWLFLNLEPGLSFPREEGWHPEPSFTLRLQIYFSDEKK